MAKTTKTTKAPAATTEAFKVTIPKEETPVQSEAKAAPKSSALKSIAKSIAGLSHDERKQLHRDFSKHLNADNDMVSVGRIPDGSNYNEWVNTFE